VSLCPAMHVWVCQSVVLPSHLNSKSYMSHAPMAWCGVVACQITTWLLMFATSAKPDHPDALARWSGGWLYIYIYIYRYTYIYIYIYICIMSVMFKWVEIKGNFDLAHSKVTIACWVPSRRHTGNTPYFVVSSGPRHTGKFLNFALRGGGGGLAKPSLPPSSRHHYVCRVPSWWHVGKPIATVQKTSR
jgi:hypothetical protein